MKRNTVIFFITVIISLSVVAGVRGTDFFALHVKGLANLSIKEGTVDIYNPTKCVEAVDTNIYRKDCDNVVINAGPDTSVMADFKAQPPKLVTEQEIFISTKETTIAYTDPEALPNLRPISFGEESTPSPIMTASLPRGLPPVYRTSELLKPMEKIRSRDVGWITTADLLKRLDDGKEVLIFDVRDKLAYSESMVKIKGSVRVPINQLARVARRLPPGRMIVTYGSLPNEAVSSRAAAILMNNGYQSVFILEGGLNGWEFYDYPVVMK